MCIRDRVRVSSKLQTDDNRVLDSREQLRNELLEQIRCGRKYVLPPKPAPPMYQPPLMGGKRKRSDPLAQRPDSGLQHADIGDGIAHAPAYRRLNRRYEHFALGDVLNQFS